MKRLSLRLLMICVALYFLSAGGAAFAFFTAAGSGSAHFDIDTLQPVTAGALTGGDSPGSALLPGGATADVILRLDNPNAFDVTLVDVSGNGAITADATHPGCSPTEVSFTDQSSLGTNVPAGSSLVHMPGSASMSSASPDACQGATFYIPVSVTVTK